MLVCEVTSAFFDYVKQGRKRDWGAVCRTYVHVFVCVYVCVCVSMYAYIYVCMGACVCSLMWINWSRMVRQCGGPQLRYRKSSPATTNTHTHIHADMLWL